MLQDIQVNVSAINFNGLFSWWLIEKPVLGKRDILKRVESYYLEIPFVKKLKKLT